MYDPVRISEDIMLEFAHETGLSSDLKPRRYLWTDAFAVCSFIELYRRRYNEKFLNLALKLVDQVHFVLGRHREDDSRRGWISGLSEEDGFRHPTIGGLRIGKPLPERKLNEPFDEALEWERDGQYYHYLTKWMHALNRVSKAAGDLKYKVWAIELAKTAHKAFTYTTPDGRKRMYWKMSIDLSRPLVSSMGLHDPLDGLVTFLELWADAPRDIGLSLMQEIKELSEMCIDMDWATEDPLGAGELLWNAYTLARLISEGYYNNVNLLVEILNDSLLSLELCLATGFLRLPASLRLAFRELGLSIGLKAAERMLDLARKTDILACKEDVIFSIKSLTNYRWIADSIERFWLNPSNRTSFSWRKYKDINMVMLATSLTPDEFIGVH